MALFVTDSQTNPHTVSTGGLEYDQLREFLAHLGKEDPNTKFIRTHEPTDAEVIKCLIVLCVFRVLSKPLPRDSLSCVFENT